MRYNFFFILLLISLYSSGQKTKVENERFNIEILHARKLGKIQIATNVILKSKVLKTISVKLRTVSKSGEKVIFDINKFSLVDEENKTRSRPMNVSAQTFTKYFNLTKLVHRPLEKRNYYLEYDPTIKDTFTNYDFEGFTTIEIPVDYDGWGKQDNQIVYFKPEKFKNKRVNFFFPFLKKSAKGSLYYGDKKIAEFNFK
jgi:hypothetical protein